MLIWRWALTCHQTRLNHNYLKSFYIKACDKMEITEFINLPVYTSKGRYVGEVRDVLIDIEEKKIDKLILTDTNKEFVEGGMDVAVPYRWVSAVGDIIILSYFPERVEIREETEEEEEEEGGKK